MRSILSLFYPLSFLLFACNSSKTNHIEMPSISIIDMKLGDRSINEPSDIFMNLVEDLALNDAIQPEDSKDIILTDQSISSDIMLMDNTLSDMFSSENTDEQIPDMYASTCEANFRLKIADQSILSVRNCEYWQMDFNYRQENSLLQINGGTIKFDLTTNHNIQCHLSLTFTSLSCGTEPIYQVASTLNLLDCDQLDQSYRHIYEINKDQGLIVSFNEIFLDEVHHLSTDVSIFTKLSAYIGTANDLGISLSNLQTPIYLYGYFSLASQEFAQTSLEIDVCHLNDQVNHYDLDEDGVPNWVYGGNDCVDTNPINQGRACYCGDQIISFSEVCDDGLDNSDSPNARCRSNCLSQRCGDGIIDQGETCDEAERNSNQFNAICRTNCTLQRCGDGVIDQGEICDQGLDNSDLPNARCRSNCLSQRCGDGIVDQGEICDDGSQNSNRSNASCRTNCTPQRCGDGIVDQGETCDDANSIHTDGCLNHCQIARCGDGIIRQGFENCDEGENNSDFPNATCRTNCLRPGCGDGVLDVGEICDQGIMNSNQPNASCRMDCTFQRCGDGIVDQGETCDDANLINSDECLNRCQIAICGDGVVRNGIESCDDGNQINDDRCTNLCAYPCAFNCPIIEMILIQAGTFNMGSDTNLTEQPIHEVQIRNDFYVAKTEVTVRQYRACVDAGICTPPDNFVSNQCNWTIQAGRKENHPVNCVDWYQSRRFAQWVGGDLLSEAQWEYTARGQGQTITFPWGNIAPSCLLVNESGCLGSTSQVCGYQNGNTTQGICDMAGNVSEWILDEYHTSYDGAPVNELAWCSDLGICNNDAMSRISRGGSWGQIARVSGKVGFRQGISNLNYKSAYNGFRIARVSP